MDLIGFSDVSTSGSNGTFRFETGYASAAQGGIHWHDNATNAIINGSYTYNTATEFDHWHHIVVTVSDIAVKSYYDGQLKQTYTTNLNKGHLNGNWWLGESTTRGCIQDVRIYDHALSDKEVEEIAKGLILHYKLDNNGLGNPNYLTNSSLKSKINNFPVVNNSYIQTFEKIDGYDCFHIHSDSFGVSSSMGWPVHNLINAYPIGTKFTFSAWIKTDNIQKGTTNYFSSLYYGGSYNKDGKSTWIGEGSRIMSNPSSNSAFDLSGKGWTYCYIVSTFTRNDYTGMSALYYLRDFKGDIYLRDFKLEIGDQATFWVPHESELLENNNIIDSSGYGHYGELYSYDSNGSIIVSSNSPRYNVSTFINSANNTTNTASGTRYIYGHCALTNPTTMSVAFWCKPIAGYGNSTGQGQFCTTTYEFGSTNVGSDYQASAMNHRDSAVDINDSASTTQCRPAFSPIANEWHHYVITYDGQNGKVYKDGVQSSTASFSAAKTLDSFIGVVIGFSKAGGVWRSNQSYFSDFRVYVTALTVDQVVELYHTSASIDNKGNLYARELIEN